jgi:hypothetical protein
MDPLLLNDLANRAPIGNREGLLRVLRLVARELARRGSPASRAALASIVGDAARSSDSEPTLELEQLYAVVASETSSSTAVALELTQSTIVVLSKAIGPDARRRLRSELPASWGRLLDDPHDVPRARRPGPAPDPAEGRTLASARPGAQAPISDATPERGHADSIARSDDPHGDRKLSGGEGPVPHERTLADRRR